MTIPPNREVCPRFEHTCGYCRDSGGSDLGERQSPTQSLAYSHQFQGATATAVQLKNRRLKFKTHYCILGSPLLKPYAALFGIAAGARASSLWCAQRHGRERHDVTTCHLWVVQCKAPMFWHFFVWADRNHCNCLSPKTWDPPSFKTPPGQNRCGGAVTNPRKTSSRLSPFPRSAAIFAPLPRSKHRSLKWNDTVISRYVLTCTNIVQTHTKPVYDMDWYGVALFGFKWPCYIILSYSQCAARRSRMRQRPVSVATPQASPAITVASNWKSWRLFGFEFVKQCWTMWTQFAAGSGFRGPAYWYYVNPAPWHDYRS